MKKICITGSLHWDILVNTNNIPKKDETVKGSKVYYLFGGKGGNQALSANRYGSNTYFIGRVGKDNFGEKILNTLKKSSIDIKQLQVGTEKSGMSVAVVDKKGNYSATIVSGANLNIDCKKIIIKKDTGILLLQNEIPEKINLIAAKKAKEQNCEVWINAAPARKITQELLELTDIIIMNKVEAEFYKKTIFKNKLYKITKIITLGSKGLKAEFSNGLHKKIRAFKVKVISTHGAGDAFIGAMASYRLKGNNIISSLNYGQAAAALHISSKIRHRDKITEKDILDLIIKNKK